MWWWWWWWWRRRGKLWWWRWWWWWWWWWQPRCWFQRHQSPHPSRKHSELHAVGIIANRTREESRAPSAAAWVLLFQAWAFCSFGQFVPNGANRPRSLAYFIFDCAPRKWYKEECVHQYPGKVIGFTMTRGALMKPVHGTTAPTLATHAGSPAENHRSAVFAGRLRSTWGGFKRVS